MKKIFFSALAALYSTLLFAQEETKQIDVNINTKDESWYASPWVWVVGAAVFILLLVALTRRRSD